MTPDERAETEAQADRCRRRGEIAQALQLYRTIVQAFPDDVGLMQKLSLLAQSLQPLELHHPKANLAERRGATPLTDEQRAEGHVERGELTQAVSLYRAALRERPGNTLLSDRLAEVFAMLRNESPPPAPAVAPGASLSGSWERADTLRDLLERLDLRRKR